MEDSLSELAWSTMIATIALLLHDTRPRDIRFGAYSEIPAQATASIILFQFLFDYVECCTEMLLS